MPQDRLSSFKPCLSASKIIDGKIASRRLSVIGEQVFFLHPPQQIYGVLGSLCGSAGLQSEKHFRTINVQWIGQWGLLAVLAIPRINNLRVINTPNSSTPVASKDISFIINCVQTQFNFVQ